MKNGLYIIFILLGIMFLVITYLKYTDDYPISDNIEETDVQDSTKSQVVRFWEYYDKATDLRTLGESAKAAEYYDRALQIDPDHQNSLYHMGNMQLTAKNYTESERCWKHLIEINPASVRGYVRLGTLYSCRDSDNLLYNLANAAESFGAAFRLNMENTGALLQLAKIDLANGHPKEAARKLDQVLNSNFRNLEAYFLRGYLEWQKDKLQEAEEFLKNAKSIAKGFSAEFKNVGEGETKSGSSMMSSDVWHCSLFSIQIRRLLGEFNSELPNTNHVYKLFDAEATP